MIPEWLTKGTKVRNFQTGLDYTIDCNSGSGLWYFTDGRVYDCATLSKKYFPIELLNKELNVGDYKIKIGTKIKNEFARELIIASWDSKCVYYQNGTWDFLGTLKLSKLMEDGHLESASSVPTPMPNSKRKCKFCKKV